MTDTPKPTNAIAQLDSALDEWHAEWKANRAMIKGARAVRAGGEDFLPRFPSVSPAQHEAIIRRTAFFPGASRTHKGVKGLLFRKPPTVIVPKAVEDILQTITIQGDTILDLCEDVADETLTVNFGVLLTDYPVASGPMSVKEAIDKGIRPRVLLYPAEAILGMPETGDVNNRKRITRLRLSDNDTTIRELLLVDGVYTVNIWRKDAVGNWSIDETFTPTRQLKGGKVEFLNELPVTLITTGREYTPHTAPLYDVCDLNQSHYHASANLATCDFWLSNPIPWVTGAEPREGISATPGSIWQFAESDAKVGMLEYTGSQAGQLESRANTIRDMMAAAGARILAPEKAAVESGQALEIRNAAESATIDGVSRVVEHVINDQLKWVAWWLGLDEGTIAIKMSSDFVSAKLTPEERKQIVAEWQAGFYSHEQAIEQFKQGNSLTDDFDLIADREIAAQEVADRPPVDAITPIEDKTSTGDDEAA